MIAFREKTMPGHEYFTPREAIAHEIMKYVNRARNVALAFSLAAFIPVGLRVYESSKEKQLVPTPVADYFFPRTARAELSSLVESHFRRDWSERQSEKYEKERDRMYELSNDLASEVWQHSLGEAAAEAGTLIGLGWFLQNRIKRRAKRRFNPKS